MLRNILILCLLSLTWTASGQSLEDSVDFLFSSIDQPDTPGAAIAIIRGDSIYLAKGYGMADLEHNIPVTASTVFMAASVSKQFTAYGIALLATRGEISLQDPVTDYIVSVRKFTATPNTGDSRGILPHSVMYGAIQMLVGYEGFGEILHEDCVFMDAVRGFHAPIR